MLRADPDMIMVGEIRDAETARIAIESALTGHLVLSTLHTNDAPSAITRLTEMGIEPFLTASALDCVVAQRLARKLCTYCKKRTVLERGIAAGGRLRGGIRRRGLRARRLRALQPPGYKGRIGLYEVMTLSDEIRALTIERASSDVITRNRGRAGHADAARRRPREGQAGHHLDRRGRARHVAVQTAPI